MENEFIHSDCAESADDARRARERFLINTVLRVTPMDRNRQPLVSQSFAAVGKDLSTTGIAVSHAQPIHYSRVVITTTQGPQFCVEAEVAWTRPTAIGLYETGFKLVRKLN